MLPLCADQPVRDVVEDGIVEQDRLLLHQPDLRAPPLQIQILDIVLPDQDSPLVGMLRIGIQLIPALQQTHDRALTGARGTNQGRRLVFLEPGVQALEHLRVGSRWVGEMHILEDKVDLRGDFRATESACIRLVAVDHLEEGARSAGGLGDGHERGGDATQHADGHHDREEHPVEH